MAATRTQQRRVLPDKAGPFTVRELTEFIRLHEINITKLQGSLLAYESGQRSTFVGACLTAGMTMPQVSAILDLKAEEGTSDGVFVSQLLRELGRTKDIAIGAAEAASAANIKAERVDQNLRNTNVVSQVKMGSLPSLWSIAIGILTGALFGLIVSNIVGLSAGWGWFVFVVVAVAVTFIVDGIFFSTITVESNLDVPDNIEQKASDGQPLDESDDTSLDDPPVPAPADTPKE